MAATARRIGEEALGSQRAYGLLTELCDDIGARLSGSVELDRALDWAEARLAEAGHERVRIEPVMVPKWVRGAESLSLLEPESRALPVLGIGGSVPTAREGITGELLVVSNEAELEGLGGKVRDKIVLIDRVMPEYDGGTNDPGYGKVLGARVLGPSLAAKQGAAAVLVRSLTARSLGTLHTGALQYADGVPKIPAASITIEDASYLRRLLERKKRAVLRLFMQSRDEGLVPSGNVVAELSGREHPEEIVLIGAHIDSWDVGQGAEDDGAGVVIGMEALSVLRRLGLKPRRTIRLVLFTNEENGVNGAKEYARVHANEKHVAAVESDTGSAAVVALGVDLSADGDEQAAVERLRPVLALLGPLSVMRTHPGLSGADVAPLVEQGALGLGLIHDFSRYFDVHHTPADTLDKVDPRGLTQSVAVMAVLAYALAELDELPPDWRTNRQTTDRPR